MLKIQLCHHRNKLHFPIIIKIKLFKIIHWKNDVEFTLKQFFTQEYLNFINNYKEHTELNIKFLSKIHVKPTPIISFIYKCEKSNFYSIIIFHSITIFTEF